LKQTLQGTACSNPIAREKKGRVIKRRENAAEKGEDSLRSRREQPRE